MAFVIVNNPGKKMHATGQICQRVAHSVHLAQMIKACLTACTWLCHYRFRVVPFPSLDKRGGQSQQPLPYYDVKHRALLCVTCSSCSHLDDETHSYCECWLPATWYAPLPKPSVWGLCHSAQIHSSSSQQCLFLKINQIICLKRKQRHHLS